MKRGLRGLLAFMLVFVGPQAFQWENLFEVPLKACDTIEECDAEAESISSEKERLKKELSDNQNTQKDLNEQIFLLIDQIRVADEELKNLQESIERLLKDIESLEKVIKEKEKDVKELLVQQQKENNTNIYLTMLMSADSISDFMMKMNAVETINGAKQTYINDLENDKRKLEESKQKLEDNKQQVETSKQEKQSLREQSESKLAELHALEEHVHGQISDLELSEDEILRQRAILSGGVAPSNGWYLPAASGYLTCEIGCYSDHIGTDFGMRVGTPVYAIANGKVVYTQYSTATTGFGTMIVVAHTINGEPHISIYAHLSGIHVNPGDDVRGGQQIGASGNTGASTGPHLHLEIVYGTHEYVGKDFRRSHLIDARDVLPRPSGGWYW